MKVEEVYGNLPVLETERLILRKIKREDAQHIYRYCSDDEVSKYTMWSSHRSIEDTYLYIHFVMNKYDRKTVSPWGVVVKESGELAGTAGFVSWDVKHAKAELGYALSRVYWNRGYMTEAVRCVMAFGFERMNLVRIEARCHPDNTGSSRVMEKAGMTYEGTLRKQVMVKGFHEDVKMYSILREEFAVALVKNEDELY